MASDGVDQAEVAESLVSARGQAILEVLGGAAAPVVRAFAGEQAVVEQGVHDGDHQLLEFGAGLAVEMGTADGDLASAEVDEDGGEEWNAA